jgi:hypothetical protein
MLCHNSEMSLGNASYDYGCAVLLFLLSHIRPLGVSKRKNPVARLWFLVIGVLGCSGVV